LVVILASLAFVQIGGAARIVAPPAMIPDVPAPDTTLERDPPHPEADGHPVPGQYHHRTSPISPAIAPHTSRWKCCGIDTSIDSWNDIQETSKRAPKQGEGQYQQAPAQYQDDTLMLRIAGFLGLAYVAFLVVWIWATRFRPR
jgi:hypothetical protein